MSQPGAKRRAFSRVSAASRKDETGKGRALWLSELQQTNYGVLAGVYRHIGDNLKIGVGYNFGKFSDDLTDLTLDDEGVFVNVIGKF